MAAPGTVHPVGAGISKAVLTPEQVGRLLELPDGARVTELSLSANPPGLHVRIDGDMETWRMPSAAAGLPAWRADDWLVPCVGAVVL